MSLYADVKVLAFAGSSREGSVNKKLVSEAANLARQMGAQVTLIDLKDYPMPFFNEDLEAKEAMPEKAKQFKQLVRQNSVIMIAAPEYNSSLTALLKNTLDWVSRKEDGGGDREAFKGKKFVIMSASPGGRGGARGLVHLRSILEAVGGTVIPQQVVVPDAYNAFDEQGHLKSPQLQTELKQLVEAALKG